MSSSYQTRGYQRPEEDKPDSNVAELIGTGLLAGAGLGSIAGMKLGRNNISRGIDPKKKEAIRQLAELNKKPAANAGVRQKDLNNVDVEPSKTPTRMKEVYQEVSQPVEINKTPQLTGSTKVSRPNTFIEDYTRELAEQRIGEQQVDDALQALNLTAESRSERARQYANVRRVQAAAADDIIEQLKIEKTAQDMMGPRPKFPIDDPARQKDLYANNPLQFEREVTEATTADLAYDNERAFIEEALTERRNARKANSVDQAATASNSGANQQIGRVKHRLQQNEDVNLAKIEKAEDLADAAIQQQVQNNNIPLTETPNRDAGINLVSSQSADGLPVDQAELVATGQGSVQQKQSLQNVGISSGGSSVSDLSTTNVANNLALSQADIDAMNKVGITGVKSAGVRTSLQDDNLRRKEFTPQQVERVKSTLKVEKPSSQEFVNEQLEQRLNKLQQETLELKAKQETLSRAAGLMSQGLNPETTRFDNALASGMVGRSGLKPSSGTDRSLGITDSTFQKNVVLSKNIEEALPTTQRLFYEQDTEGNIIPETVEKRQERPVRITQEDTKTLKSAGGRIGSTAQTKSVIGPYGIERENFPKADVTKRPTDTGGKKSFSTQPPAAGDPKESMTMAEEVRKVYNNPNVSPEKRAGKAQELLASKMKELNISAIGESQPLRKNAYRGRRRLR
jgi:hypothetical protein